MNITLLSFRMQVMFNRMLLAEDWVVAKFFIGNAVIGLRTSLRELAVFFGAAFRKLSEMSIGNIIGSNIFDGPLFSQLQL